MKWMNLFLTVCMWIVLPIQYGIMRNNTVCKNNLILSVTLPPEARQDAEVLDYCQDFRRRFFRVFLLLTAAALPPLFCPWVSVATTWLLVWLLVAMAMMFRTYGKGYAGLKAIKRRRGWQTVPAGQTVVETKELKLPKPLKAVWFILPMLLSALPVISCFTDTWDASWYVPLMATAASGLTVTAACLAYYVLAFRQKPDAVDDNPDRTAALTRVRRYNWTKFSLLGSWLTALFSLAVWCCRGNMAAYLVVSLLYAAVLLAASLMTEFAVRRAQQRLNGASRPVADEDDCWIWGQFYYNPHSEKLFVQERVGMGLSMNYARPAGKAVAAVCVVLLLLLPLIGVWTMVEELSPVRVTVTGQTVCVSQAFTTYTVELPEVEETERLEALPSHSRVWGTGMDTLLKGTFSVEGYGTAELCLNPQEPPFVALKTAGTTYIFNESMLKEWESLLPTE